MNITSLSPDALNYVCTLVRDRAAIELEPSKAYLIEARLGPVAKHNGFATTADLIQDVRTKPTARMQSSIVEAMTTNETSFFRDLHPFEVLQKSIIPELRTKFAASRTLNIWSAACSTGQELYSIAIVLREHFPDLMNWNIGLLGTDLSDEVLERARAARFSQIEVNRGLSASLLVKYFERDGMQWQLCPELRSMATFAKLNLIERWVAIPKMDVVFLRNVLIYFSPETKKLVLQKLRQVMAPHAVLFLGAAETTMNLDSSFERVQIENGVFYRRKEQ